MKTAILLFAILAGFVNNAAPNFVTPSMIKRNGLTDEQYQKLWAMGKNPKIDIATARDWVYRSSRFANVTNWLDVIGRTNNYARLVVPTMTTNEWLRATNSVLTTSVKRLRSEVDYETARAERAENDARALKELRKAAKRAEKNLEKVLKALEQAKKKAATEDESALWTALIEILQGRDPNAGED